MNSNEATANNDQTTIAVVGSIPWKAWMCAVLLIIAADRLLFGYLPGISYAIFLLLMAICVPIANEWRLPVPPGRLTSIPILIVSLIPLSEAFSWLSLMIGTIGLALSTLMAYGAPLTGGQIILLLVSGPVRLPSAIIAMTRHIRARQLAPIHWISWVLPIGVGLVFVVLFRSANPIIEDWIASVDLLLLAFIETLEFWRAAFWVLIAVFCWPFLQIRLPRFRCMPLRRILAFLGLLTANDDRIEQTGHSDHNGIVGSVAITRSLLLFNALFAVQSVLDLIYLWGGATLPDGMTYAAYAHRGAYPLVATALLAGGFVLIALRPGSETEKRPLTRALVLIFAGQNVLLVISSILRLDLYVAEYSLTLLRLAALIWMALVVVGLVLILIRVFFNRTNGWLIAWNMRMLVLTLYVCSLLNMTDIVARYNVAHSFELSGRGTSLDISYLLRLGPETLPALNRYITDVEAQGGTVDPAIKRSIRLTAIRFIRSTGNWRSWTFRRARLMQYLKTARYVPSNSVPFSRWR